MGSEGQDPRRQRLRPPGRGSRFQLLPQVGPKVSAGDADMGVRVLDDHLVWIHGPAWQGQAEETRLALGSETVAARESAHPSEKPGWGDARVHQAWVLVCPCVGVSRV